MTPESEFKKFLIVILLLIGGYVLISTSDCSKYVQKLQTNLVSKIFLDDKEITSEISESEQRSEDWFTKNFKKKNPYEYWISGNVKINSLSNYNNVSKEQIYTFRKYYVNKTIFKNKDYVPNEEVFGKISENNKWLGVKSLACMGSYSYADKSMANDSKFINNPAILVGIDYATYPEYTLRCSEDEYLIPKKLSFSKDDNTFYLTYDVSEKQKNRRFKLVGLNARDLGYNYAFCRKTNNVNFANSFDNISKNIYKFKDAIRVDSSCRIKGGCNNNIAFQEELFFDISSFPATFELKLWTQEPENENSKGDINFTIILE